MVNGLVSVVMIFLNPGRFIEEAIESVLDQSYQEWELLLVDDGSTDGSTQLMQRYAERWPDRIRYLEHPGHANRGMSASRNLGIRAGHGEFVAFLDADDVWLPNKLERQVATLASQPRAALVYGPTRFWYSWANGGDGTRSDFVPDPGVETDTLVEPPALLTRLLTWRAVTPGSSNFLVRREIVDRVGGYEESFRALYEDQVFLAKVCLTSPVFVSSECWSLYRQHPDSSVSTFARSGREQAARQRFLTWLAEYLSAQAVEDPELWRTLRQQLRAYRHQRLHRLLDRAEQHFGPAVSRYMPAPIRLWLWAVRRGRAYSPPPGWVRFGSLRRLTPISRSWGFDRGLPIDRFYIERFLATYAADVRGHTLEFGDDIYTRRFGGAAVTNSDVLDGSPDNPKATIVGELTCADQIPSDAFDCVILTQTLHLTCDVGPALRTVCRILKPGGIVLATFPGISRIPHVGQEPADSWYWGFTTLSARRLFTEACLSADIRVKTYGNVLAATAFLQGLAAEELRPDELEYRDPEYAVLIAVRAEKPR